MPKAKAQPKKVTRAPGPKTSGVRKAFAKQDATRASLAADPKKRQEFHRQMEAKTAKRAAKPKRIVATKPSAKKATRPRAHDEPPAGLERNPEYWGDPTTPAPFSAEERERFEKLPSFMGKMPKWKGPMGRVPRREQGFTDPFQHAQELRRTRRGPTSRDEIGRPLKYGIHKVPPGD